MTLDAGDDRLADYLDLNDPARRRHLERDELFIVEGPVALAKLVRSGHPIRSVLTVARHRDRVGELVGDRRVPILVVSPEVMRETVGFDLHRGIVAAATRRPLPTVSSMIEQATARAGRVRLVVCEGLNDPENLGLVARSARAFGAAGLLLDPTCIDPYYRRTVRVSMGEVLLLPVARSASWPGDLDVLHDHGFETWALTPAGAVSIWDAPVPDRVALVLGAEGPGLTAAALGAASTRVAIPIDPTVDSINVGHAAAVALAVVSR